MSASVANPQSEHQQELSLSVPTSHGQQADNMPLTQQTINNAIIKSSRREFCCLYTKHKTQKRKVWHDGRLVLSHCRASLHDANPTPGAGDPTLDQCEISSAQSIAISANQIANLETEKYLITVDGPWKAPTAAITSAATNGVMSTNMNKLLNKKFRKPAARIPPRNNHASSSSALGKRRRLPLQPGELQRKYYSSEQTPTTAPAMNPCYQQQPSGGDSQQFIPPEQQHYQRQLPPHQNNDSTNYVPPNTDRHHVPFPDHPRNVSSVEPSVAPPKTRDVPQQQTATSAMEKQPPEKNIFTSNGFDPHSFYGEEEEEEEEEDMESTFDSTVNRPSFAMESYHSAPEERTITTTADSHSHDENSGASIVAEGTLSTSQLLLLFGGGDKETPTADVETSAAETPAHADDFQLPDDDSSAGSSQ